MSAQTPPPDRAATHRRCRTVAGVRARPRAGRFAVVVATLALTLVACGAEHAAEHPNVLIITLDTLRADRLETYLQDGRDTTPRLDAFAQECIVFENASSNSSFTPPSHASILTGLYPEEHGLTHWSRTLAEVPTAGEMFNEAGYRTFAITPLRTLFTIGLDKGFAETVELPHEEGDGLLLLADAKQINAAALPWLTNFDDQPSFAWLHYYDAHRVYGRQGPEWAGRYGSHPDTAVGSTEAWYQLDPADRQRLGMDAAKAHYMKDRYDGGVAFLDEQLGALLQRLRDTGVLEQTIVVITADHGEVLDEHFEDWFSHDPHLVEENLHVPLLVRLPDARHAGLRIEAMVQGVDLLPTVLELAGISTAERRFSGLSLAALLADPTDDGSATDDKAVQRRPFIFASRRGREPDGPDANPAVIALSRDRRRMVRSQGHKLVHYVDRDSFSLFALPDETENVMDLKPTIFNEMRDGYMRMISNMELADADGGPGLDPVTLQMLCELGYLADCP